jgi:hypothetical protein
MRATYERKKTRPRVVAQGRAPIQVTINVEPITPCATNTPTFRQPNFSGRKTIGNTSKQGETIGGASSGSNNKISTPRGGISSTQFKMVGHDPTIRLPEFQGEALEDPKNNVSICEKI